MFEIRLIALAEQSTVLALLAKQLLGASYGLTTVLKVPPAAAEGRCIRIQQAATKTVALTDFSVLIQSSDP